MKNRFSGKFIVLDGQDGCGKSTQCVLLAQWLDKNGIEVVTLRDPGATVISEEIRQVLLNPDHIAMSTRTELLLYMAARAQLWAEKMAPALQVNMCVILDRWLSSTCAYQGYAGGFGMEKVIKIAEGSLERCGPDLSVILDVDLKTAAARLNNAPDRMEQKPTGYHQKVREGFLELSKAREDFVVIDAADDIETVHKKVVEVIKEANFT